MYLKRRRIVIIGGGILGSVVAMQLGEIAEEQIKQGDLRFEDQVEIVCYRLSDSEVPRAESLRNQGWWQSGLRYVNDNIVLARKLFRQRTDIGYRFQLNAPKGSGLVQVREDQIEEFVEGVREMFGSQATQLPVNSAKERLGDLYCPEACVFETPEAHLPVARMMYMAREVALKCGVRFFQVSQLKLRRRDDSVGLLVDGKEGWADVVLLLGGSGNLSLMDMLEHDHKFQIWQTPLLVCDGYPRLQCQIFQDRVHHFSIAVHRDGPSTFGGRMIVGTKEQQIPVQDYSDPYSRIVKLDSQERFFDYLPDPLKRNRLLRPRFTAGWEPAPPGVSPKDHRHIEPWVRRLGESNAVVGFCGRATFVLQASDMIVREVKEILSGAAGGDRDHRTGPEGAPWDEPIHMHHEDIYEKHDDSER